MSPWTTVGIALGVAGFVAAFGLCVWFVVSAARRRRRFYRPIEPWTAEQHLLAETIDKAADL